MAARVGDIDFYLLRNYALALYRFFSQRVGPYFCQARWKQQDATSTSVAGGGRTRKSYYTPTPGNSALGNSALLEMRLHRAIILMWGNRAGILSGLLRRRYAMHNGNRRHGMRQGHNRMPQPMLELQGDGDGITRRALCLCISSQNQQV